MDQEMNLYMDEINIRTIIRDLLKNLPFILLAALIALMGVRIYKNIVYVPEYTTGTTMAVIAKGNADGSAYSSLNTANSMAEVFTEVFQSQVMKEKVEESIGTIPGTVKISSSLIPETNLLVLKVTAQDPQTSYRVLHGILDNYRYVSDYLFGNAVLEILMDPEVPVAPSNYFQTSRLDKLGILAAVVLMSGLIVVLSIFRRTVKTKKAARRNLEGRYLTTIPYEVKNRTLRSKIRKVNKAILLSSQVVNFEYAESCHRLAAILEHRMDKKGEKTLLVTSVAENEGKSTVCVNLAIAMAQTGKKVLVVDADFRKPALHKLLDQNLQSEKSLPELLQETGSLKDLIYQDEKKHISVLLNSKKSEDCQKYLNRELLTKLLAEAAEDYDYVILDSAPVNIGTDTEYLKEFADCSILVIRQDGVRISDLNDTMEMMQEGRSDYLGYVLNAFSGSGIGRNGGGYYGKYYGKYYGRYHREEAEEQL